MGFFEFFGERSNPGDVGKIEKSNINLINKNLGVLIFKSIVSVALLIGVYALIFGWKFQFKGFLIYTGFVIVYCIISYWVVPKPDYSNVGWLGGIIDHPFRYSDDINRMLIFLMIFLYPGRLVSTTIATWIWILVKSRNNDNV